MIESKIGDITDVDFGIIVHQVNAQGIMAGGVAKVIRERFPLAYSEYAKHIGPPYCAPNSGRDLLGSTSWAQINTGLHICNLVGQQFYGNDNFRYTSYDALDLGFKKVAVMAKLYDLPVHVPLIGCGLGGGKWPVVSAIIEQHLASIPVTLWEFNLPNRVGTIVNSSTSG